MDAAALLLKTPLFDGLTPEDAAALAEHLVAREFRAGDLIFEQGNAGDSMFFVASGIVSIVLPGEGRSSVVLRDFGVGQYFGEISLFDAKPRSATARAATDCQLLELDRGALQKHIHQRPQIAVAIIADLAERLRETNVLLGQRAARNVVQELEARATLGERVADSVARVAGSWAFIIGFFLVLGTWVVLNTWMVFSSLLGHPAPDPYPFQFFNLLLSIIAALQGPVIMMSQNRQTQKDRLEAEADFHVNLKNEIGIETLQRTLEDVRAHVLVLERELVRTISVSKRPPPV